MKTIPPFTITARLLPGICIDDVWLSVDYSCEQLPDRTQYIFYIDYRGKEYRSIGAAPKHRGLQKGLELLLNYLGDFEIAVRYCRVTASMSEDFKLFPEDLADWAVKNSHHFFDLQCQLTEETFIKE